MSLCVLILLETESVLYLFGRLRAFERITISKSALFCQTRGDSSYILPHYCVGILHFHFQ